jgi:hypothetical protein
MNSGQPPGNGAAGNLRALEQAHRKQLLEMSEVSRTSMGISAELEKSSKLRCRF